jgi:hypothetical protein
LHLHARYLAFACRCHDISLSPRRQPPHYAGWLLAAAFDSARLIFISRMPLRYSFSLRFDDDFHFSMSLRWPASIADIIHTPAGQRQIRCRFPPPCASQKDTPRHDAATAFRQLIAAIAPPPAAPPG